MGMFDSIWLKNLPLEEYFPKDFDFGEISIDIIKNADFQTKDFDNMLSNYLFQYNEEKRIYELYVQECDIDGDGDIKSYNKTQDTNSIEAYTYISNLDLYKNDYWIKFKIEVFRGVLTDCKFISFEKTPNEERKKIMQDLFKPLTKTKKFKKKLNRLLNYPFLLLHKIFGKMSEIFLKLSFKHWF